MNAIENGAALRALVAVADDGSFRAAAARLGYTQSAISHQIALLERALGSALFVRPGGRGAVSLTAAGEVAYHHARRALAALASLEVEVRATQRGERESLHIGVFQTAAAELVPPALRALGERHPAVEIVLVEIERGDEIDALARGRLDVAFVLNPEPLDAIEAIPLLEDPWVILTWRGSPLAGAERPSLHLLDGEHVRARGDLAAQRGRAPRRLPHRRQRDPAAPGRGRARARLRRAADRPARDRAGADLARAARGAPGADRRAVPRARPAPERGGRRVRGHRPRAERSVVPSGACTRWGI